MTELDLRAAITESLLLERTRTWCSVCGSKGGSKIKGAFVLDENYIDYAGELATLSYCAKCESFRVRPRKWTAHTRYFKLVDGQLVHVVARQLRAQRAKPVD